MGWANPPQEKQRHRVTIVLRGPVDRATFEAYYADVRQLAERYGGEATPKLIVPRARRPAKRRPARPKGRGKAPRRRRAR